MTARTGRPMHESHIDHAVRGKCNPREADRAIVELASRQHGVVARRQLLAAGISRRLLDSQMGRRLHAAHRGVYAVGYPVSTQEGRWMAAVLAAGPKAVLSHWTAARLWGIASRSGGLPEITRPTYLRPNPAIRGHQATLPKDERTVVEGIPVTTVPRTVLDCAVGATRRRVERLLNEVEVRELTDRLSIPDLLARHPRHRASAVLHTLLDEGAECGGVTANDFEEMLVSLLDSHGLPRPRFNPDLSVSGRFFRPDCAWAGAKLVVELDGRASHGTHQAFEADRERDRIMLANGWRVMRITWRQLRDQPHAIAADLRRALELG